MIYETFSRVKTDLIFERILLISLQIFLYPTGFALNSILIDERLGFANKSVGQTPRFAIIPPSTPTLKNVLIQNGYEVRFAW